MYLLNLSVHLKYIYYNNNYRGDNNICMCCTCVNYWYFKCILSFFKQAVLHTQLPNHHPSWSRLPSLIFCLFSSHMSVKVLRTEMHVHLFSCDFTQTLAISLEKQNCLGSPSCCLFRRSELCGWHGVTSRTAMNRVSALYCFRTSTLNCELFTSW